MLEIGRISKELLEDLVAFYLHRNAKKHKQKYPPMVVYAHDFIGTQINVRGRYENGELMCLAELFSEISDSSIALDVGANIGNHTVHFSSFFDTVYAFEPNPKTFELLSINTRGLSNIAICNYGLSDKSETVEAFVPRYNAGGASVESNDCDDIKTSFVLRHFDEVPEFGDKRIDLVKIDCEGHESSVIEGMKKMLVAQRPIVLFECNRGSDLAAADECIAVLRACGYTEFSEVGVAVSLVPDKFPWILKYPLKVIERFLRREVTKHSIKSLPKFESKNYPLVIARHANYSEKNGSH